MLTSCPECELQISDKAVACPHCGYPLKPEVTRPYRKSSKRMRLPNGFGQISLIKHRNLRNPYRAMVTTGKDPETGKPICKLLKPRAYFPTYNEAYAALAAYHRNPYDLSKAITMQELYEKWSAEYLPTVSDSGKRLVKGTWQYCYSISSMQVSEVRARHIKGCILNGVRVVNGTERRLTPAMKIKLKTYFNLMFDYAVEYEITDRNYARAFSLPADISNIPSENPHITFSNEEISILWERVNDTYLVDTLLIQCYSGWRPTELGLIELTDVDLDNWFFKGGIKTKAGMNRIVPIHTKIRPLVMKKYQEAVAANSKYLINHVNRQGKYDQLTYSRYYEEFDLLKDKINLNSKHRLHDARVFFISQAKKYNVDEYAIKYMVGHAISDITEKVYTRREIEWLHSEIEKIK